jgi:flagella synthesis protein FlgN
MSRMTRDQAVGRLLDGIRDDLHDCGAVHELLERQFQAALRHSGAELSTLAAELMPQLDAMEARRIQRVQLVRALFGLDATMEQLFASLAAPERQAANAAWTRLERMVRECKAATARNGNLMADQYAVMQRLLHGEEDTYAPR